MEENEENEQTSQSIKICLLGNSGVGKTCIIDRYIDSKYNDNQSPNQGSICFTKILNRNGKKINLDIWDTAGQEQYRSLGQYFYKDSYIIILVYDITVRDSFEDLKNKWYSDVQRYGEKYIILGVVGNKCDLYEKEEIPEEEAKKFADEINAIFMLISAKTGNNINLLFEKLIDKFLEKKFQKHLEEIGGKFKETIILNKNDIKKKKCC